MTRLQKDRNGKQTLWFIRRAEGMEGPFPSGSIRRFILLGRVSMADEIKQCGGKWMPVSEVTDLLPREIEQRGSGEPRSELVRAQLREDERCGRDRRETVQLQGESRRRGGDRRRQETELVKRHRLARSELAERSPEKRFPLPSMLVLGLCITCAIGYGLYLGVPPEIPDPDCRLDAAPDVDWRNCVLDRLNAESADLEGALLNNASLRDARLSGARLNKADLQYANFSGADLSYAELRHAALKGAGLRNADLSYADLYGADLSFSELYGANLGGANLDLANFEHAIWIDGSKCLAGSIGECRSAPAVPSD